MSKYILYRFRNFLFEGAKLIFYKIPSENFRISLKNIIYTYLGRAFRNNRSYIFWLTQNQHNKEKASLKSEINFAKFLPSAKKSSKRFLVNKSIDIIIPVYKGYAQTKRCIESVLNAKNKSNYRIIIINDASPENLITSYLTRLSKSKNKKIVYLENIFNLGFTESVNRGMNLSAINDVLLLNSDTIVANNWLDKLMFHAYSKERVATVTPFSNNATICNYPTLKGFYELPRGESVQFIDNAFYSANIQSSIELPTAVGFCMYIRRKCLKEDSKR
jgi:hypothetical protein